MSLTPRALACGEIVAAGIAAIGGHLARRRAADAMWRSSMGRKRSLSAGLPASMTRSRIRPLLPVTRLSLWPYWTSRPPLTMMSACGSNRLTSFSPAGTACRPDPALALGDDALDQRQIVAGPGAPALDQPRRPLGQPRRGLLQLPGRAGDRRSARDRAGAGCPCRGCTRSPRASLLGARGDGRASATGAAQPSFAASSSRVITRTASHNRRCRSARASAPR